MKTKYFFLYSIFIFIFYVNKMNSNTENLEFKITDVKFNEQKDTLKVKLNIKNHNKTNFIIIFDEETFIKNGLFQIKFISNKKSLNIINFRET